MSEPIIPGVPVESRSSAEIAQNSKGEPVVKVKVYADKAGMDAVREAVDKALEEYKRILAELAA